MTNRFSNYTSPMVALIISYIIVHFSVWYGLQHNTSLQGIILQALYIVTDVITILFLFYTWRRIINPQKRVFWRILLLACMSFLLADLIHVIESERFRANTLPVSPSDAFYIGFIALYVSAFAYKIILSYDRWQRMFIVYDVAITLAVALTLEYHFIVHDMLLDESVSGISMAVLLTYLLGDLLTLLIAITLIFRPSVFASEKVLYILIVSLFVYTATDITYDYIIATDLDIPSHIIIPFYHVALLLIALAGVVNVAAQKYLGQQKRPVKNKSYQTLIPYTSAFILGIVILFHHGLSDALTIGLIVTFAFVLLRERLSASRNVQLLYELEDAKKELERRVEERTEDLLQSEQRFKSLYDYHPDPIFTLGLNRELRSSNHAGSLLLGYRTTEFIGKLYLTRVHPDDMHKAESALLAVQRGDSTALEVRAYHKDGSLHYLNLTLVPIVAQQKTLGAYIILQDVTHIKKQEQDINYLAYHDVLTSTWNRPAFMKHLEQAILQAQRTNETLAVMFMDLDRFKAINDTLGHAAGDAALAEAARRLKDCVPPGASLARLGGDEFTLLVPGSPSISYMEKLAAAILQNMRIPFIIHTHSLQLTSSIGIALYPEGGTDASTLLQHADLAMYHSKTSGKNHFSFYTSELSEKVQRKLRLEKDLSEALANEQLFLLYQPQMDIAHHRIIGFEALIRWKHPELGIISPVEFIAIAEESGLIIPIGQWTLRQACLQMKAWQKLGYMNITIGVNISAKEFEQPHAVESITAILRETNLDSRYLDVELTERIAMRDEEETITKLRRLKHSHISISIDDFGTGYSSLSYLPLYSIDTLKIPREFISMIHTSKEGEEIVLTILSLAKTLHMSVIAEGIETEEQAKFLLANGCHKAQGYYYSKPLDAEACYTFLQQYGQAAHK